MAKCTPSWGETTHAEPSTPALHFFSLPLALPDHYHSARRAFPLTFELCGGCCSIQDFARFFPFGALVYTQVTAYKSWRSHNIPRKREKERERALSITSFIRIIELCALNPLTACVYAREDERLRNIISKGLRVACKGQKETGKRERKRRTKIKALGC